MFKKFEMDLAGRPLIIETGKMAKQASGAVLVRYGDTVVLVTATGSKTPREGADFFPLTVDYEEKIVCRRKKSRADLSGEKGAWVSQPFSMRD